MQVNTGLSSGMQLAQFEAVRLVRDLARKHHDNALAIHSQDLYLYTNYL